MRIIKPLLLKVGGEALGVALLVAFVVAVATMPPIQVAKSREAVLGYNVRIDTGKWEQTFNAYLDTLREGSLGRSRAGHQVSELVFGRLLNSLTLLGLALLVALLPGVLKGIWDFNQIRSGKPALGPMLTGVVQGLPDFWLVMIIQLAIVRVFLAYDVRPFPAGFDEETPIRSLVMPVLCLGLIPWAYVARITSTSLQTVYEKEFIRTARAKGLHEWAVMIKHTLMAAVVPILDGLPNALGVMFSNLLIVEYLFYYPGVTILLKDAVSAPKPMSDIRVPLPPPDVPVLVAAGVTLGLIFWLVHMLIVALRRVADPRLKEGGRA